MNFKSVSAAEIVQIWALFSDREHAEAGVDRLRGAVSNHVGVDAPAPGGYQRCDPTDRKSSSQVRKGAAMSASVGTIGGLSFFKLIAGETSPFPRIKGCTRLSCSTMLARAQRPLANP